MLCAKQGHSTDSAPALHSYTCLPAYLCLRRLGLQASVGWNITTPENNNCNSMGRFTVLSMLKKNVANTAFPDPTYLESPASNPDPAHKAITFLLRMLDWVKVPGHW